MQTDGDSGIAAANGGGDGGGNTNDHIIDVQKEMKAEDNFAAGKCDGAVVTIVSKDSPVQEVLVVVPESAASELLKVASPITERLSMNGSICYECRICSQEKEEELIELGCLCRGGLGRTHKSCITAWFELRNSNICEICKQVAVNVPLPQSQTYFYDPVLSRAPISDPQAPISDWTDLTMVFGAFAVYFFAMAVIFLVRFILGTV